MLVDDLNKLAIDPECSLYQPGSSSLQEGSQPFSDDSNSQPMGADSSRSPDKLVDHDIDRKAALERFMDLCDMKSLGSIMKCPWEDTTAKTHNQYVNKVSEIIAGVIKTVAPDSAPELWQAVMTNDKVSQFLQIPKPINDLVQAIVESYKLAEKSQTRRQLLSIIANKVTYSELVAHIATLTRYEFTAARRYALEVGAELPLPAPSEKNTRERVDPAKLEHFLDFITSSNIVQDLPFGRRTLMLTNGRKIDIPNVIRTMLPSRLIKQYIQYCNEKYFTPLSTRTLFRILSEACVASVRKSLQGLDSYAAEGGCGFDDLVSLLDMLMQYGSSDNEIYNLKDNLKHLKQYIKSDYKVCSPIFRNALL